MTERLVLQGSGWGWILLVFRSECAAVGGAASITGSREEGAVDSLQAHTA